jgi:uncharacterized protein
MGANGTENKAENAGSEAGPRLSEQGTDHAGHAERASAGAESVGAYGSGRSRADALRTFDLEAFIRAARETRGVIPLAALPRVVDLMPSDAPSEASDTPLRWHAEGEMRKVMRRRGSITPASSAAARPTGRDESDPSRGAFQATEPHLTVTIDGAVWLECQRCMQPFSWPVAVAAGYRVARDERQADSLAGDDAEDDVIVGSADFDLLDLIDEEIVLSLPMVPKHRVCPTVHASVVSGADGALGVDRVEDIDARLAEAAGDDPTPLPGERGHATLLSPNAVDAIEAGDDVAPPRDASVPRALGGAKATAAGGTPTRKPFASALAGWKTSAGNAASGDDASKTAGADDAEPEKKQ